MARLSSYSNKACSSKELLEQSQIFQSRKELKEMFYKKVPAERIMHFVKLGKDTAFVELKATMEQILSAANFSSLSKQEKDMLSDELLKMILGLGPLEKLLNDEDITEVMVNGPEQIFFEKDGQLYKSRESFIDEEQLRLVIDRIVTPLGRRVDEQSPIVNARLKEGHRVNVVIPPISLDGTILTIRKFRHVAMSLADMVALNSLTQDISRLLIWAVLSRKNIAVCGGTGGGKTTLLNALSQNIPPQERIITIEDSAELRFDQHPHVVRLEARNSNSEGLGKVSIRDLVINALRMRPDRIVVGECRGEEAIDMLQAMNTGHDGSLTTLHANSPSEVVSRLVMMVRYGMDLPTEVIESQIISALDIVIQQDRTADGHRRITQVAMRNPKFKEENVFFKPIVTWNHMEQKYEWSELPLWINELSINGIANDKEINKWKSSISSYC